MKHLNKRQINIAVLVPLTAVLVLAGLGSCAFSKPSVNAKADRPRFTMQQLDAKARPFIDEANAAIPDVVATICADRLQLCWLLLKDKFFDTAEARNYISTVIGSRITAPLGKAAAVYQCALNTDAAVGMTEDAALEILSRQLYSSAGLAVEAVCIKATMESCAKVLAHCAPKLAASWGLFGTCAAADGPFPIGDVIGVVLAVGGSAWCCWDLYEAYEALPENISSALHAAISSTIAQCRQEAASAL
jgi:hypothetical protein